MMKAALCVSRNCRAHLSDFYVAPWSACLHAFRVTPGTPKAVLRPLPRFNCSNGITSFSEICFREFPKKRIIFWNQLSSGGFRLPILMKIESRMARYPCNFQVFRRIGIVIRSFHSFLTSPNFFHFFARIPMNCVE